MEGKNNNIGVVRLFLASMVIIGHAPEMTDGNRHREPLTMLLGTLSLGEVSVDAFFLLSGYLIAQSMVRTKSVSYYMERRILRIYPAFVVSYILCVFVLGPVVGAHPWNVLPHTFGRLLLLQDPMRYPGQLANLHYPALNGSMWTIAYEFRCYLLVAVLGSFGFLSNRWLMLVLTALSLLLGALATFPVFGGALDSILAIHSSAIWLIGFPSETLRLTAPFLVGASFYVYRDALNRVLGAPLALAGAALAIALMYRNIHLANFAISVFGALPFFWLSLKAPLGPLQKINSDWDISYGTYLYGWPIATFILWMHPNISPWFLAGVTLPLALFAGAISWWGIEKQFMSIRRSKSTASADGKYKPA